MTSVKVNLVIIWNVVKKNFFATLYDMHFSTVYWNALQLAPQQKYSKNTRKLELVINIKKVIEK